MAETIHFEVDKSCLIEDDADMVQTALHSLAGFKQLYLNLGVPMKCLLIKLKHKDMTALPLSQSLSIKPNNIWQNHMDIFIPGGFPWRLLPRWPPGALWP
jgi:hypothetical protein